jgi:hypothetical protein
MEILESAALLCKTGLVHIKPQSHVKQLRSVKETVVLDDTV